MLHYHLMCNHGNPVTVPRYTLGQDLLYSNFVEESIPVMNIRIMQCFVVLWNSAYTDLP
jgi:hypothetical protein